MTINNKLNNIHEWIRMNFKRRDRRAISRIKSRDSFVETRAIPVDISRPREICQPHFPHTGGKSESTSRRRTQGCGTSASTGFRHRGKHVPRRAGRSQRQITAKESDESSDSFLATSGDKAAPFLAIELAIENLQRHKNCTGDAQRDDRIEIREMISDSGDFTK